MFSSPRFLAYLNKPSVYYLQKAMPIQRRLQLLKQLSETNTRQLVTNSNPIYKPVFELMKQQKINQIQKYQESFLWSPHYTPKKFVYSFLIPFSLFGLLLLYIYYIAVPKRMMQLKIKYGIRFREMEKKGYLDGWYDQYFKKDKVLEFEAHSLSDMEKLYKEGMLAKTVDETIQKIEKKQSKFMRGDKQFISKQFKTN